jgi:hypothetical protein
LPDGVVLVRQLVPTAALAADGLAKTRTIYLNHHGATLTPGTNNSQRQTSTIIAHTTQVPGWEASADDWAATVACMKSLWSRFDVTVTDVDPGTTPHIEALFGGSPTDVGMASNIGGVSPFSSNCSVIENSIVFAFTDNLPKRPRTICEVMSQEIAHSYGLDHELLASDPLTYLPYIGNREFQDVDAPCGESKPRACGITGVSCRPTQNSVQLLLARLGAADRDNEPPSVGITAPAASATIAAGFAITAAVSDNVAVASVAFYLDGELLATKTAAPYELATAATLARGAHTIVVEAIDADGNSATQERDITVTAATTADGNAVVGDDPGSDSFALGCSVGGQPSFAVIAIAAALIRRRRAAGRHSPNFDDANTVSSS